MKRIFNFLKENKLIGLVLLLWIAVQLYFLFTYPQSERPMLVISWDTFGYYLYLPATFIYHDLFDLKFVEAAMGKYPLSGYFYAARLGPTGHYVMNYSLGTAVLYFPFFCLGHLVALISQFEKDGFSAPYQYSIFIGGIFYSLLGLLITARNLRFFFSEKITGLLLIILLFGTNYLYYALIENAMTHSYLFTVGAFIIYYTIKWHDKPSTRYALMLGLFIGLAIIIRPTEIFWCLIPLLWTIKDTASVKQKLHLVTQNFTQLLLLIFIVGAIGSLQMIYWKAASGKYIYYSYDGAFDFLSPHIIQGLFSIRKGWLIYTPLMSLALLGLPMLWIKNKPLFLTALSYTALIVYITFSWHAWSYGGSFGCRPLVQSYALLLFPMGAFLEMAANRKWLKIFGIPVIVFLLFLNCYQTFQYERGFINHDGLTWYHYKMMFLKDSSSQKHIRAHFNLLQPTNTVTDSVLITNSWFNPTDTSLSDSNAWLATEPIGKIVLDTLIDAGDYNALRVDAKAMFKGEITNFESNEFSHLKITVNPETRQEEAHVAILPLQPLIGNKNVNLKYNLAGWPGIWDDVYLYTPQPFNGLVLIKIELKNPYYNYIFLNNLRISLLKTELGAI